MSSTLPSYTVAAVPSSSAASAVTIEEFAVEPTFETRTSGSWTVVNVQGELDLSTSAALRAAVEGTASGPQAPRVAVDLTGVTFMDSSSLGVLVACLKEIGDRGGEMRLVGVSGSPAKVIALTGLDAAFTIDDSVDDLPA
jgi:anti-sigma B factor antagonist